MCRLFGFRSVIPSQVHQSLVSAENALMVQSERHPDGWGVAYYVAQSPHVIKSSSGALNDSLFKHVSGIVSSETVVAHVRQATQGNHTLINSHPFQYGRWIFAHNGNIPNFESIKPRLIGKIAPVLRRFILGDTDSEVLFYLLLSHMSRRFALHRKGYPLADLNEAIRATLDDVHTLTEQSCYEENELYLSFLITNGESMAAHQGGKELYKSTYKKRCPERDTCPSFAPECETPSSGFVSHLLVTSEKLQGHNVWEELSPGDVIGVDWRMHVSTFDNK